MKTSVIIVGQGLCGTWLSYWLQKAGIDFIMIDEERPNTSTRVASGVINPVTGRRMTRTWNDNELIPFAVDCYTEMGNFISTNKQRQGTKEESTTASQNKSFSISLIERCDIIDFFNSPDRRKDFEEKSKNYASEYLNWDPQQDRFSQHFHYDLGFGIIAPAYQVDLQTMLDSWRQVLAASQQILNEPFDETALQLTTLGLRYKDIIADKIVFATGMAAAQSGYFQLLPFALNKGEALVVDIPGLPNQHIYKKGNTITPWLGGYFWVGSTYNNFYTDVLPSQMFRLQMENWLQHVVKHEYNVLDHLAAIRPATVERRPFAGWHPQHPQVGILNGTGTKGVTLAPYFAHQLVQNILRGEVILPQADVARFAKVLGRI